MGGVLLQTIDQYLNEIVKVRAGQNGYIHEPCGEPYEIGVQDADGRCFRWVQGDDAFEAIIYLACPRRECWGDTASYIWGRVRIDGKKLSQLKTQLKDKGGVGADEFLTLIKNDVLGLFEDFEKELCTTR